MPNEEETTHERIPTRPEANAVEAFAGKTAGIIDNGAIAVMVSIGQRPGRFDTFAGSAFVTSEELARNAGLSSFAFEVRDLTGYCEPGRFDLIVSFDAVHEQNDPEGRMRGYGGSLRLGGRYLMQETGGSARLETNLDFPMATLLDAISCLHCTPASLGQGGAGFGTMWVWKTAEAMLKATALVSVARHVLPHHLLNARFAARV